MRKGVDLDSKLYAFKAPLLVGGDEKLLKSSGLNKVESETEFMTLFEAREIGDFFVPAPQREFDSIKEASGDSKPKENCLVSDIKDDFKNSKAETSKKVSIRNLPLEEKRAYFAAKQRESYARKMATEDGRNTLRERSRKSSSAHYHRAISDPEQSAKLTEHWAERYRRDMADPDKAKVLRERARKNQRARRARVRASRDAASPASPEPV